MFALVNRYRHCQSRYVSDLNDLTAQQRIDKINLLEKSWNSTKIFTKKPTQVNELWVKSSYIVAHLIIAMAYLSKNIWNQFYSVPGSKRTFWSISKYTVVRRIEDLAKNIESRFTVIDEFHLSLKVEESRDVFDIAQLYVFKYGINDNF